MEERLHDNTNIRKRIVRYPATLNEEDRVGYLSGHNEKTCVEVRIMSVDFEDRFIKSIRPLEQVDFAQKLADMFDYITFKKKKSRTQRVGTGTPVEATINDCVIVKPLFEKMLCDDCHYSTYLKEFDGHIPHRISCVIKSCEQPNAYKECVCSILGEMFGMETVYNFTQDMFPNTSKKKQSDTDKSILGSEYYGDKDVYSVDFIPYGYKFEDFSELDFRMYSDDTLEIIYTNILKFQPKLSENLGMEITHEQMENVAHEICKQIFVKRTLLRDNDITARNFGVLYNKESGDVCLAPAHDMELCFSRIPIYEIWRHITEKDVNFLMSKYPDDLYYIMDRANNALSSGEVDRILNTTMQNNTEEYQNSIKYAQIVKDCIADTNSIFQVAIARKYVSGEGENKEPSESSIADMFK